MTPAETGAFIVIKAGGMMPNQAWGTYKNIGWYFRARHGKWALSFAEPKGDSIWAWDLGREIASGQSEAAGWWESLDDYMPFVEALVRVSL
jgi:hypothetical protein